MVLLYSKDLFLLLEGKKIICLDLMSDVFPSLCQAQEGEEMLRLDVCCLPRPMSRLKRVRRCLGFDRTIFVYLLLQQHAGVHRTKPILLRNRWAHFLHPNSSPNGVNPLSCTSESYPTVLVQRRARPEL
uniref:Uncharacterized protein n=1 Tax=Cacopsylla melanoneura TaxID=428564 RepID=A0A8D8RGR6_9HEMI